MGFEYAPFSSLFLCPQKNGLTRPKRVRGTGFPMVNMGELFAYERISNVAMDRVPIGEKEYGFVLEAGDLLFARQSLVLEGAGQCSIFVGNCEPTVFESHIIRCRLDKSRADPDFYFYFLKSYVGKATIGQIVEQGAGASGIRGSDLATIVVPIPPLEFQRAVADILRSIDDRIDLLRQTNTTLEAIAQALFKSWFVDFDPVHAKAEGCEPEAMDAATAALFPSEFEESELGQIPKGWRTLSFGDAAYLSKGSVNPLGMPAIEFQHYSLPAFDVGQLPMRETGDAIKSNKTPVPSGAILVSKLNPHIPRIWPVGAVGANAVCSTEFLVWLPKAPASSVFVYCLASSQPFNSAMRQLVTGTSNSHQRVKPDQLNGLRVCAASDAAFEAFAAIASPLLQRILDNRQQAATLADLRDTLLPRLISGKLRLPEVTDIVAESLHERSQQIFNSL
jgi:type I restriction enzyme S subunit